MDIREIDEKLSAIVRGMDFYSLLTPVNREEEEKNFFENFKKSREYNPVFRYRQKDLSAEKEWLKNAEGLPDKKSPAHCLLKNKIGFVLEQIRFLECGDNLIKDASIKLYGIPEKAHFDEALNILADTACAGQFFPEEDVTPGQMADELRAGLISRGIDWEVVLTEKIVPKITVSGKDRTIYINSAINYTQAEILRLMTHELDVHVLRGVNGTAQPFRIFVEGLAGYTETEEGLAVFAEEVSGCLETDIRQKKIYAGRALAAYYCMDESFYGVFKALTVFFPDYLAYRITERTKRGLRDTSVKGGITKGFHYISGLEKVRAYVERGGDLSILYVGKIGLSHIEPVAELLADGILKPPRYLPGFLRAAR
ncbi:MAG: tyrosine/phenylalanine carboxypeptidase domain-containing protein [Candidatus Omnitrophota bacterium]